MSKQKVMHYECDNCDATSEEQKVEPYDGLNRLPADWVHMVARANGGTLFDLDLCTKCTEVMRKALLRRSKK
jgi:hypothetical protein